MKNLILLLTFIIFSGVTVSAQGFKVKKLSAQTVQNKRNKGAYSATYKAYVTKAYSAEKSLPKKYRTDGTQDYTSNIQSAINKHDVILLPNFPILISDTGLKLRSNQVLLFQPNSLLKLKPTAKNSYNILSLNNISNVKIYFANIEGDKYSHLAKDGQWGFGISIKSSRNINIYSPYIKRTWGDGIYIGQLNNVPSENIFVYNAVIDDVRRNGISITSGRSIDIVNCYIANTHGNSPESGLDIEPNSINDAIENVNIKNLSTYNNKWAGLLFVFEQFKSNKGKSVSINVDGHTDDGSKNAVAFHGYKNTQYNNLSGAINLANTNYRNNSQKTFLYKTSMSKLMLKTADKDLENKFNSFKRK
ncbi:hypothetical protein [Sphingobacterium kitahiroshimense]|uniref:Right handed beta helix domain-containing protein n=1 Tax=Sphingobacterium kitahiroshimense TaxID=470446 RepID=A0ABV0C1S9_9SPHI